MRKVMSLVLVLVIIMTLPIFAQAEKEEAKKEVVIKVWSNDAHNKPEYDATVKKFNETIGKEKGIRIEYKVYGGDYYSAIDVAIAAGEEPHIFKSRKSGQYAETNKIVPIKDLPGGDVLIEETKGFHHEDIGMFGGEIYAIPIRVTTQNLIYNKEMFAELGLDVPVTYDEFRETAKIITEKGGSNVYGYGIPLRYENYKLYHIAFPAAPSVGHQIFHHGTGRWDFMSLKPFFELMLGLVEDGSMFPGMEGLDFDTLRAHFSAGNIGMLVGNSFDVGVLYDQFPAQFDWGVAPLPVKDPNNRYKQIGNPGAFYVISSKVVEEGIEEEAMEVYKTFLSVEHLASTYENAKDIPIRGEAVTKFAGQPERPQWAAFADLTNFYVKPAYPESKMRIEGESYGDVFSKILTKRVGIVEGLSDLDKRYNAALDAAVASGKLDVSMYIDPDYDENVKWVTQ